MWKNIVERGQTYDEANRHFRKFANELPEWFEFTTDNKYNIL
jgi:hypothetical protein